jgi:hypothetical protein
MMATRRCIGLDVHRDFAQVAIWQAGQVMQAGTFATTPEGVREFAASLGPADEVALEATGNTWAITALEPAALAATARALADAEAARAERLKVFQLAVERARYQAGRARRQYDACEPENRLVARTLEAAWENKLAAVTAAEASLAAGQARQPSSLADNEVRWLAAAGADIRAVFDAPSTTPRERKQLIRALLTEITVTIDQQARTAALTIYREGGASSSITVTLPRLGTPWRTTDTSTVDLVRRLAEHHDDATIASVLARQGRRTGRAFTKPRRGPAPRPRHPRRAPQECHPGRPR